MADTKKKKRPLSGLRGGILGRTATRRSAGDVMAQIRAGKKKKAKKKK